MPRTAIRSEPEGPWTTGARWTAFFFGRPRMLCLVQVAGRGAVLELLPQLRDGLEPRTLASESPSGRCRRASAARRRRPAAGDPSCCRYSGAPTGRRLGCGLRDPLSFQIGRLGAPHLLSPARARYSWSAGLGWAEHGRTHGTEEAMGRNGREVGAGVPHEERC